MTQLSEGRSLTDMYADPTTGLCDKEEYCETCPVYDCCPFDDYNAPIVVGKKESTA